MALIVFHVQDSKGQPIGGALANATSTTVGPWAARANPCGDIFTNLAPAHYSITFTAPGYAARILPADLADPGVVTVGLESTSLPFKVAPRYWKGNMGGIRVANLPFVSGMEGAPAGLFLSWFYDRYDTQTRGRIRETMRAKGYTHWLLSWPDARAHGCSLAMFKALCEELIADGFFPCVMLCSKDFDDHEVNVILAGLQPVLDALVGVVPMFCVGWELSLWQNPTTCQQLIDAIAPRCKKQAGTLVYVHFQEGYPSFQQPGHDVADFWNPNVGKLDGLLYQKVIAQNDAQFLDSIYDNLVRFAGGFNMVPGFDWVALELSVMTQFSGATSEAEGDRIGRLAINAPAVNGKSVDGSGNGS